MLTTRTRLWAPSARQVGPGVPAAAATSALNPVGGCCSGDVLGRDRLLPKTQPGDVMLIGNGGAYGAVMASYYNRRVPATEVVVASVVAGSPMVKAIPNSNFPVW